MYYVYVLRSDRDSQLYVGFTENLEQRVSRHNSGDVLSTRSRRPLQLIFFEGYYDKGDAIRRERYLKTGPGKRMLKLMIRNTLSKSVGSSFS